jgi:hypothetical protein
VHGTRYLKYFVLEALCAKSTCAKSTSLLGLREAIASLRILKVGVGLLKVMCLSTCARSTCAKQYLVLNSTN